MVRARHILLKVGEKTSAPKKEIIKKKIMGILAEYKNNKVPFEKLAERYSEGPSKKMGGDLGFFARGRMVKAFEDACFGAKPGGPLMPLR